MVSPLSRQPDHSVDPQFVERWSPRAFSPEPVSQAVVDSLLEAARWAPSAYNSQPWKIHYAHREDADWPVFLDLLVPGNREWAQDGSALFVMFAQPRFYFAPAKEERDCATKEFDCGAAWMAMALQAHSLGLHLHAMIGFDMKRANAALGVAPELTPQAMMVLGQKTDPEKLNPSLQRREAPTPRRAVSEFAVRGCEKSG